MRKKFVLWLAKILKVDCTVEKIVEIIVEKQISLDGVITGDVTVKGNLMVEGSLEATGEVTAYK